MVDIKEEEHDRPSWSTSKKRNMIGQFWREIERKTVISLVIEAKSEVNLVPSREDLNT